MIKTVLITCHRLTNFSGSECMVYDFCTDLLSKNYDVKVITLNYNFPIKSSFENEDISVSTIHDWGSCNKNYDLVISFHSVVVSYLLGNGLSAPLINYFCLGTAEELETPPIYHKNLNGGYFNSVECMKHYKI